MAVPVRTVVQFVPDGHIFRLCTLEDLKGPEWADYQSVQGEDVWASESGDCSYISCEVCSESWCVWCARDDGIDIPDLVCAKAAEQPPLFSLDEIQGITKEMESA